MTTKISSVADVLFAEFEKINKPGLKGEALKEQIDRSKAVVMVSKQIVEVGRLVLDAKLGMDNMREDKPKLPSLLDVD